MKSKELLPFDRNRYYKGKMLTSSDFEAEQIYINNKRRFVNQNVVGSGIICGFGVTSLDDLSIMVESGAALDCTGREIVLENSAVKKLSTIAGFEDLASDEAMLCVRYAEKSVQPVYAINQKEGGEEYENNRIEEGYELFLMDAAEAADDFVLDTEFFTGGKLAENEDYRVSIKLPARLSMGTYVRVVLEIIKKSDSDRGLFFEGVLSSPAFAGADGSRELNLLVDRLVLSKGEKKEIAFWASVTSEVMTETSVMIKAGSARASVDGSELDVANFSSKLVVTSDAPNVLAERECGKVNLEFRAVSTMTDYIKLAKISLVRTESAYFIESIVEDGIKNYISTPRDAKIRSEYERFFVVKPPYETNKGMMAAALKASNVEAATINSAMTGIETGIVEVALGGKAKRGDICYSSEIMHGLGKGDVYVEIGHEALEFDAKTQADGRTTVYGNPSLFSTTAAPVNVETAVKVFNDKGSFVVAVKLLEDVEHLVLTYRYVAFRCDGETTADELDAITDKSIAAVTPTVVLASKETYFFQVEFNNMKPTSVSYELTEAGSGEITADGVYTAPTREGVYEIRIYVTDKPLICTYAYAIVKKKAVSEYGNPTTMDAGNSSDATELANEVVGNLLDGELSNSLQGAING